jgi:small subunit ribosomal protein S16
MLKIRMQRIGRIKQASYRIVVTEHTSGPKAGKVVEQIGTYNPKTKARSIKADRVTYWMSVGAKPSDTMHNMLVSEKIIKGTKRNVLPKNKNKKVAEAPAEVAAA